MSLDGQYGEAVLAKSLFESAPLPARGRFLDIGAYDGETFSNTRLFVPWGWGGVLVEPSPRPLARLLELYRATPEQHHVVAAVVSAHGGRDLVKFFDSGGDALSSTEKEHVAKWRPAVEKAGNCFTPYWTLQIPIWELVTIFPGPYHLVSIDTEGTSAAIWDRFPDDALSETRVAIVEHDGEDEKILWIAARGRDRGFQTVEVNSTNSILWRAP
jgi:FkbM family methyltransferase